MTAWRYRHHSHTFQLFCLHRSARTPSLRANVQGARNQGIWCGLATIFMAALLGLPGQPMYWRTVEVQSLMLLPCGPRIVVGLLVELVGDPLLSPYRRSHESSRVPSSADGGWRGPLAGSQASALANSGSAAAAKSIATSASFSGEAASITCKPSVCS